VTVQQQNTVDVGPSDWIGVSLGKSRFLCQLVSRQLEVNSHWHTFVLLAPDSPLFRLQLSPYAPTRVRVWLSGVVWTPIPRHQFLTHLSSFSPVIADNLHFLQRGQNVPKLRIACHSSSAYTPSIIHTAGSPPFLHFKTALPVYKRIFWTIQNVRFSCQYSGEECCAEEIFI
jgi:hypothetical protein